MFARIPAILAVLLAGLTMAASFAAPAAPISLYVSPSGDDAAPGTLAKPLATFHGAQFAIRKLRAENKGLPAPVNVYVRGGLYFLSEPFALSYDDCGESNKPVVYQRYKDEVVTISGARPVKGFQLYRDGIWKADLGAQGLGFSSAVPDAGRYG